MASSISASSSQSQNAAANTSAVGGSGTITITVGNFYGLQSWGRVTIGDASYDTAGPTAMNQGDSWSWSASRGYTHDANGVRGAVGVSVSFWIDGTSLHANSASAATQPALDYDRKPAAPSSVTPVLNADRTITVTSNAVSSPAGTATYYISYASSTNGGSTWSSWSADETIASNLRFKTYAVGALPTGTTYKWRMKASNSDGTSAYTESATLFYPSSGKRWNGTAWVQANSAKRYTGSAWADLSIAKRWNGTAWADLS